MPATTSGGPRLSTTLTWQPNPAHNQMKLLQPPPTGQSPAPAPAHPVQLPHTHPCRTPWFLHCDCNNNSNCLYTPTGSYKALSHYQHAAQRPTGAHPKHPTGRSRAPQETQGTHGGTCAQINATAAAAGMRHPVAGGHAWPAHTRQPPIVQHIQQGMSRAHFRDTHRLSGGSCAKAVRARVTHATATDGTVNCNGNPSRWI